MRAVERLLERLGHHEVLDIPDTFGRPRPGERAETVWHFKRGYAARRLRVFAALRRPELTAALERLRGRREPAARALRGRILRLLGDAPGARRELAASRAEEPGARAAGWLGELMIFDRPRAALPLLDEALRLDPSWPWPRLWKAAALLSLGRAAAAREQLDAFRAPGGGGRFIHAALRFQAAMMSRVPRRALAAAGEMIRLDPASPAGHDAAGKALKALGRDAAAMERFHDARERDLDVMGTYVFDGLDLEKTWGAPEAYLAALDRAVARRPRVAALYAERAELKRDPRFCRYEEALEDYARAVRLEPRRGWLRAVLARAENNLRGGRAGLDDFDAAVRLAPASGWIRAWRGALRARLGDARGARADFRAAAALMPWYPFTYAWRGALLRRLGRSREALRDLDAAVRLDSRYAFSLNERFEVRRALGDFPGAVRDLNAAFAMDPKYGWPPAGALRQLAEAVRRHPREAWLHAWRGKALLDAGDAAGALRSLDRAAALEPGAALARAWRGRALRVLGRGSEAARELSGAVRLDPRLWTARKELAELQEEAGRLAQARASMAVVTRLAPTTVPHLLVKARLALRLNRRAEARRDLERAMQLDAGLFSAEDRRAIASLTGGRHVI